MWRRREKGRDGGEMRCEFQERRGDEMSKEGRRRSRDRKEKRVKVAVRRKEREWVRERSV